MKLSPNTRYAVRILLELRGASEPLSTALIAEKTGMSLRVVENIHAILRQQGITGATIGARGGIQLLKPLGEISLGLLVRLFDDGVEFRVCCGEKSNDCPNQGGCGIRSAWRAISDEVQKQLDAVSLEGVLRSYPLL